MKSGSVASMGSGSQRASAAAASSCHQWSRPSDIATSTPARRYTTTCSTRSRPATASSAIRFSGSTFPRRYPASAVTRILDSASSIRSRIARALNPPKITLWTAPIRAHASIAAGSSGIIGM